MLKSNNIYLLSLYRGIANIKRNFVISFLCLGIISFALFIQGFFTFLSYELRDFASKFSSKKEIIFYLKDGVTTQNVEDLVSKINIYTIVSKIKVKTPNQSGQDFESEFPDLKYILSEFETYPFPYSVEVSFKEIKDKDLSLDIENFIKDIKSSSLIDSYQMNSQWAEKIGSVKNVLTLTGYFFSLLFFVVSGFIVFNVIRINLINRSNEINILSLVGATDGYIKTPFIIEGTILGIGGAVLAIFFHILVLNLINIFGGYSLEFLKGVINFTKIHFSIYFQLLITGAFLGFSSSWLSVQRYLKKIKR